MEPISRKLPLSTGLTYHVLEWLPDDAACDHTVVLVHGFLDLSWGWKAVVDAGLAGRYHIVAPDMRGHGDSDRAGAGGYYYFMDYLADLHDVIELLGRERVSLVGHSMGGAITGYYAGVYPERIYRLALIEGVGPPRPTSSMPTRVRKWIEGWKEAREEAPRTFADQAEAAARLRKHDPLLGEDLALELARHSTTVTEDGRLRFKHDPVHKSTQGPYPFVFEQARQMWNNIACPVLLVESDQSWLLSMIPDLAERYACIPNSRRVCIEDASHMMLRHRPDALARELRALLDE